MPQAGSRSTWIDVTRPLVNGMIQWPLETPFRWRRLGEIGGPGTANVSEIHTCVHVGTHIDAPLHFIEDAADVAEIPLDVLCGCAVVVHVVERRDILPADLIAAGIERGDRVLFRTVNEALWNKPTFDPAYFGISFAAAKWLVRRGVRAVGVDYLSVDRYGADQEAHYALLGAGIPIIEGLDLSAAFPGRYEMVALPLPIPGSDGSPARVILRAL